MKDAIKKMDQAKIKGFLQGVHCDWEWDRNSASASHMRGVWERQIRSVRSVLTSRLNDEALRTLLFEVEAIVNSRPLSADLLSDESIEPLTPNQLLTMKTKGCASSSWDISEGRRVLSEEREGGTTSCQRILVTMEERVLSYVTTKTKMDVGYTQSRNR